MKEWHASGPECFDWVYIMGEEMGAEIEEASNDVEGDCVEGYLMRN